MSRNLKEALGVHTCEEVEVQGSPQCEASLAYLASSRSAWTIARPCPKKNPKKGRHFILVGSITG